MTTSLEQLSPANLVTHLLETHHEYVKTSSAPTLELLNTINQVHGDAHPELEQVLMEFNHCIMALNQHLMKEERILFPYIQALEESGAEAKAGTCFGSVENPIAQMLHEHDDELERFARIRHLTNDLTPPEGACNTYQAAFEALSEFEADLKTHIQIENTLLFPKAIELEHGL